MKFEEIIEVAAKWIEDTDDIQGYEIDLYDSLYPLGNVVCKDNAGIERDYEEYKRSMINYQITLKDSFNSFQDVNRIALSMVQECYYFILGAHFVSHDKKSLIIRFVTVSTWCYITGTIEIIGPHYEKLYQEYLDFIARSK
jgi:hypothetical protein